MAERKQLVDVVAAPDEPAMPILQLFFAKVLRSATEDEVKVLFTQFGGVCDVNLFRAFQGAPTTKVRYGKHGSANTRSAR
jgi:hypothetical protein